MEVIGKKGDDTFGLVVSKDELRLLTMVIGNISGRATPGSVCRLGNDMYYVMQPYCGIGGTADSDKHLSGTMKYLEGSFDEYTAPTPKPKRGVLRATAIDGYDFDEAVPF